MPIIRKFSFHLLVGALVSLAPLTALANGSNSKNTFFETPVIASKPRDELVFGLNYTDTRRDLFIAFQALDSVRVGLSFPTYTEADTTISGNDLNISFVLMQETDTLPAIAVGVTGIGSEGRGTGEYIAASKTFGDFQATAGLGWGSFAGLNIERGSEDGVFTFDHLFQDDTAPFGSLAWNTPVSGLSLGLEYGSTRRTDGSIYEGFNAGLRYTTERGLSYAGYVDEDGDVGVQFNLSISPSRPFTLPNSENAPLLLVDRPVAPLSDAELTKRLREAFAENGINLIRLSTYRATISVTAASGSDRNFARVSGRVARILAAYAPSEYTRFAITQTAGAFDTNRVIVQRAVLAQAVDQPNGARLVLDRGKIDSPPLRRGRPIFEQSFTPRTSFRVNPRFSFDIQSSEDLDLVGDLSATATYAISRNTRLRAQLAYRFLNQWDQNDAPDTPQIRSDFTSYTPDTIVLQAASASHRRRLSEDIYGRVSAGLFERMYGGVSAEAIWRDPTRNYSLGLEATYVQKRDYEDPLGFQDLTASTLIGSLYANYGDRGDFAVIDAGRYLAGDFGVSLTIGRDFDNGWRVAAFTKWSDERESPLKFGVSLAIPLDWAVPGRGKDQINVNIGGSGGDETSRVGGTDRLAGTLRSSDPQRIRDGWGAFWD